MHEAVVTAVEDAGINRDRFQEPERKAQIRMVEHAFIQGVMAVHRLGTQAVNAHHIVDRAAGSHHLVEHFLQKPLGTFHGHHLDPCTHRILLNSGSFLWRAGRRVSSPSARKIREGRCHNCSGSSSGRSDGPTRRCVRKRDVRGISPVRRYQGRDGSGHGHPKSTGGV